MTNAAFPEANATKAATMGDNRKQPINKLFFHTPNWSHAVVSKAPHPEQAVAPGFNGFLQ